MIAPLTALSLGGSSPRVRGTLAGRVVSHVAERFIPACAGNTNRRYSLLLLQDGSSPRVRGTPRDAEIGRWNQRFIPACAGNT